MQQRVIRNFADLKGIKMNYKGYEIRQARLSGGKAGKGYNRTSTMQVYGGNHIIKQIRFLVGKPYEITQAVGKAKLFIDEMK